MIFLITRIDIKPSQSLEYSVVSCPMDILNHSLELLSVSKAPDAYKCLSLSDYLDQGVNLGPGPSPEAPEGALLRLSGIPDCWCDYLSLDFVFDITKHEQIRTHHILILMDVLYGTFNCEVIQSFSMKDVIQCMHILRVPLCVSQLYDNLSCVSCQVSILQVFIHWDSISEPECFDIRGDTVLEHTFRKSIVPEVIGSIYHFAQQAFSLAFREGLCGLAWIAKMFLCRNSPLFMDWIGTDINSNFIKHPNIQIDTTRSSSLMSRWTKGVNMSGVDVHVYDLGTPFKMNEIVFPFGFSENADIWK